MDELRVCQSCNYQRGFHVSFKKVGGRVKICLVCPNCGQSYDLGWSTSTIKSFKTKQGIIY